MDPFFIGLALSLVGMVVGSVTSPPRAEEAEYALKLHVTPVEADGALQAKRTHSLTYLYVAFGVAVGAFFVVMYAIPYLTAVG